MRLMSLRIQPEPSRHGVHCPHDSFLKNRAMFLATATTSVSSSKTVGQAVPAQDVETTDVEVHGGVELVGAEHPIDTPGDRP